MNIWMKIRLAWIRLLRRLGFGGGIYYIGGAETLPPPLSAEEEAEILAKLDEDERSNTSRLMKVKEMVLERPSEKA